MRPLLTLFSAFTSTLFNPIMMRVNSVFLCASVQWSIEFPAYYGENIVCKHGGVCVLALFLRVNTLSLTDPSTPGVAAKTFAISKLFSATAIYSAERPSYIMVSMLPLSNGKFSMIVSDYSQFRHIIEMDDDTSNACRNLVLISVLSNLPLVVYLFVKLP